MKKRQWIAGILSGLGNSKSTLIFLGIAAVIGIFTFVVLSVVSLIPYRSSGSYKNEEGFK